MKRSLWLMALLFGSAALGAQTPETKLGLWWGSWSGQYLHGVNEITFETALPQGSPWSILAKIRSYGTWFFFSKESYDFELGGSYLWDYSPQISVKTQAGVSLQLRLAQDIRSPAPTTWAPWIKAVPEFRWEALKLRVPVAYYFYSGGHFFKTSVEAAWDFPWFGLQLKGEVDSLALGDFSLWEHRLRTFIGVSWPGTGP